MGIYSRSDRIETVKFGNADMVCMMQANHILALGTKYWAINMGEMNWSYYAGGSTDQLDCFISLSLDTIAKNNAKCYCAIYKNITTTTPTLNAITIQSGAGKTYVWAEKGVYANASEFKTEMNGVWLVFEFDGTLYEKKDFSQFSWTRQYLGGIRYNYYTDIAAAPSTVVYSFIYDSNVEQSTNIDNNLFSSSTGRINCTAQGYSSVEEFTQKHSGKSMLYKKA